LFAVLGMAFGLNAQVIFGVYSAECGFIASGDDKLGAPDGVFPRVNPSSVTFAFQVNSQVLAGILNEDETLTLALANFRLGDAPAPTEGIYLFENGAGVRLHRAPGDDLIFYINNYDLKGSGNVLHVVDGQEPTVIGTVTTVMARDGISLGVGHFHAQLLVASIDPEDGYWWDQSTAAGWNPGNAYKYMGEWDANASVTTLSQMFRILDAPECATGIADVFAAEEGAEIVGYYNLVGQKLANEPAKGIFIVKFSNGKTIKMAK